MKNTGETKLDELQLLLHIYQDQRDQLAFRRTRENDIFTWTASVLLAFIAAALLVGSDDHPRVLQTIKGVLLASFALATVTAFSITWQLKQRNLMAEHQKMLVRVQTGLGCFEGTVGFPKDWESWGKKNVTLRQRLPRPTKILATFLLGGFAIGAAVLSYCEAQSRPNAAVGAAAADSRAR